jgi:hypothetical protein
MADEVVKRTRLDYLCIVLMNVTIPVMLIWRYQAGDTTKSVAVTCGAVSAIVVNTALWWGIRARHKRRHTAAPPLIVILCLIFAVASLCATVVGVHRTSSQNDLLRIALSNTPLNDIHPEENRLFVEFLRLGERNSQEYSRLATGMKPIVPALYSVESFADAEVIRSTCASVQKAAEADFSYAAQQQKAAQDFHDRMLRVEPESAYLKVVASRSEAEGSLTALEREWLASVVTVYSFAEHAKEIHVDQAKLTFSSEAVRSDFSKLLDGSETLHRRLLEKVRAGLDEQKRMRSKAGVY